MDDTLIYSFQDVSISSNLFIANGQTYPLNSILWAESKQLKPKRWLARLLMFSGLPLLFAKQNGHYLALH